MSKNPQLASLKPEDILKMKVPTKGNNRNFMLTFPKGYACSLEDNNVGLKFLSFKIRDLTSGKMIFDTESDTQLVTMDPSNEDFMRKIRYRFDKTVLQLKELGATYVTNSIISA